MSQEPTTPPVGDESPTMPAPMTDAERLLAYEQCERAILSGHQSYSIGGDTFTRANLSEVRKGIVDLRQRISQAASGSVGGIRTTQVIF